MRASRHRQPPPVITDRLRAVRLNIQQKSVGGHLITGRTDQFYLTGFDGEDGAALILPERVYLLTDGRFAEEARARAPWASAVIRKGSLAEALTRLVRKHCLKRLGFQPAHLSVRDYAVLRKALRPVKLTAMPPVVEKLRLLKDTSEIAALGKAIRIAEAAFRAVIRRVRPGMTELQLAARLQHEMILRGASGASFPIIVAEGPNSSRPHAQPGQRKLRPGSVVLMDWGAVVEHYCSDLTRVLFVRRIPSRFRRMYEHVLAAQAEAIKAIRPGVRMCDVDAVARSRLRQAGVDRHFPHSLGHGLGLEVHEAPRLARRVTEPLQAGMVVTVEPGVYFSGVGGIRIEDDVLVTPDGCRVMSSLTKELDAMIV